MIDAERAVQIAAEFFSEFFPEGTFSDLRLEAIDHDEEAGVWELTMGYAQRREVPAAGTPDDARDARRFRIDAETGKVLSMRTAP